MGKTRALDVAIQLPARSSMYLTLNCDLAAAGSSQFLQTITSEFTGCP